MRLQTIDPLTLVSRPWLETCCVLGIAVGGLVAGCVETIRKGVSMDTTWGPLLACGIATVGLFVSCKFWTVVFDSGERVMRWRVRGVFGVKEGQIGYDGIVGVAHPADRSGNRSPPRGIALVLADGTTFRLSYFSTVRRGLERLKRLASLIRREVGIDEPGEDLALADAVLAAPSDAQGAKAVRDLLGVPLSEARVIARGIRGGDDAEGSGSLGGE